MSLFGNSNQRQGNSVNISTPFYRSYSENCMINISGWNQQLSLRINPASGKDANGVTQYSTDKGQSLITSITQDNAITWLRGIEKHILPAIKDGVASEKVTITMGGNANNANSQKKALTVWFDGTHCFFECAVGLDANGIIPAGNYIVHQFQEKTYKVGYNKETGSAIEEVAYVDFDKFVEKLRSAEKFLTPVIAHQIKYENAIKANMNNNSNGFNNAGMNNAQQAPVGAMQSMGEFELPPL